MSLASKRDPEREKECQGWVETVLGAKFPPSEAFEDVLKDGTVLCQLINKLKPGSVNKINTSGGHFQAAIRAYGVADIDVFQTVDLWEKKDIAQVVSTLYALGRETLQAPEWWSGPYLGPKPSEECKRDFSEEVLKAGQTIVGLQAGLQQGRHTSRPKHGRRPQDPARQVSSGPPSDQLASKRDPEREKECQGWVETVLGAKFPPSEAFEDVLKDGTVLCQLINKLKPGSVNKINTSGGHFQAAIRAYGVADIDVFQTVDLWEKKDIAQVVSTLYALGRETYRHPEWSGPYLGPKPSEECKRDFSEEVLKAGQTIVGLQAGSNKGATQAGQNMGAGRKILLGNRYLHHLDSLSILSSVYWREYLQRLPRVIALKLASKRDPEREKECQGWVETVLGAKFPPSEAFEDVLKDGTVLCQLINKLKPGSVNKINTSGGHFQAAIRAYGVADIDVFQTVDLWEKKDIAQVVSTLYALGRETYRHPEWSGPYLGPKPSEECKRDFSEEVLKAGQTIVGLQAGSNKGATQAGQNMGAGRKILLGKIS
ncbi:hypothetical protein MSG28_001616 [Choristoneura fumiferana]|uniref:Uncharacterized protein n=1 Tax=Choristoneura fumiferana TaxID=7141 RepID=A0ACC0KVM9_CHOFU|nr:hypothetical protein MSG28_001616 [Choristoneura fumiferana]